MKKQITRNWYRTNIYGEQRSFNIAVFILSAIGMVLFFWLLCEVLKWGFRQEEIRNQQRFEIYKMLESKLKEL